MTRLIIALPLFCTCTSATRSAPEVIATFKKCFPVEQKVAVYELDGTQSDDGWFDVFFELGYNVVHTCRMNGEQFHLLGTLQQFAVWKEFYHEEKIFDLNDNTVHQVHSLCDEPQCDCMVDKKKFYFEIFQIIVLVILK
ncbi:hypothetical protein L3Y34_010595 [Caenorhabditis briggsae]|uniref:Uncharacterized protein n=1 Tax=Caenorhabditis briggsae TaxID=6238 RepID=A0AAE9CSU3_CAEBR|nr:hypothetical protein L3Y34_010595 [Caenorhabditis briggsae]